MATVYIQKIDSPSAKLLQIRFPFNWDLVERVRNIPGRQYDATQRCWTVPFSDKMVHQLKEYFPPQTIIINRDQTDQAVDDREETVISLDIESAANIERQIQNTLRYLKNKRYSPHTLKCYEYKIRTFLNAVITQKKESVSTRFIQNYIYTTIVNPGQSVTQQRQTISALKYFFEVNYHKCFSFRTVKPKKGRPLPIVLSYDEIRRLFSQITNLKHRLIFQMI